MPLQRIPVLRVLSALVLAILCRVAARADSPAVFIKVSSDQLASAPAPTAAAPLTIATPGQDWAYSAAAPYAGTVWNVVNRPNPLIASNVVNGAAGTYVIGTINGLALVDPSGAPSPVTLTASMVVADLESGSTRMEPNSGTGSSDATFGPKGLMEKPWRIYRGGNSTVFEFAGLPVGASYYVYFYGSTSDSRGCTFTLSAANVPAGNTATSIHTSGSTTGNVFASDGVRVTPTMPAVPNTASAAGQNTVWGRLHAVVASNGTLAFTTSKNAQNNQYFNGFQLVPYPIPSIAVQPPATPAATMGSSVNLSVTASGDGTLTYQWRKDGTPISANATASTSTLTIGNVQSSDAGSYDVVITNPGGSVTSSTAVLSITTSSIAPSINTQPVSQTAVVGGAVSFALTANGTSPLGIRWQKSNDGNSFTDVDGATATVLTVSPVQSSDAGHYRAVVTNTAGSVTSDIVTLTVAPVIKAQPVGGVVNPGTAASLSVTADAGAGAPFPTGYVWKREGVALSDGNGISGSTTATLQFSSFGPANSGSYTVTASNPAGSVTSTEVYLGTATQQSYSFAPGNNANGIAIDQQLRIVFPSAPKLGRSGKLTVRDASDDSIVATIDREQFVTFSMWSDTIRNASTRTVQGTGYFYMPIAIYGNEVWITLSPTQRLSYGKTYYVNIDAALILDSANAALAAITDKTTWRFSTKSSGPATPTASTGPTTITVGHDGTGDFATLQGAADWIPQNNTLPRTIEIKPGIYRDNTTFAQNRNLVTIRGTGASRTDVQLLYPYASFSSGNDRGAGTLRLESSDITVRNLTIDNAAYYTFVGPINTVATTGKRLVFENILMKGGQDTLYTISGIAYFKNCEIWGSVDFIYGAALAVFDRCDIVEIRSTGGPVGAPNTALAQPYGLVFLNCNFPRALIANGYPYDVTAGSTTMMRPWRQDGYMAVINCSMGSHISTRGWDAWDGRENTCRAIEYGTTFGSGSAVTIGQRQAAGAYWLNTIDPDYTNSSMLPTDPLLSGTAGIANRLPITINPADYTLAAIFGHAYFASDLNGWMPSLAPTISAQPGGVSASIGQVVTFTVVGEGTPAPTYQWYKNGAPISGATLATYTIAAVASGDAGDYTVILSNSAGQLTSSAATLVVGELPAAPVFSVHPASQAVSSGAAITLMASASGSPSYQWQKDGAEIPDATGATYTISSFSAANAGTYTVVATNAGGSTTSEPAVLSIAALSGPGISTQPVSRSVAVGTPVTFSVTAAGAGTLTYQWQKEIDGAFVNVPYVYDGNDPAIITDLSGITTATLSFVHAQVINAGRYRVLVTDSTGMSTSDVVTFAVNSEPVGALAFDGFAGSVTGGGTGQPVVVTTPAALKAAVESSSPAVITVTGVIDLGLGGRVSVSSNKTLRGADTGATILGSLSLSGASNVIIANLNISARTGGRASNDGITVGSGSSNVLITKCTLFDCTDGNLDVTNGSDNVTISWCKFYYTRNTTHNFSNLIGSSDTDVATSPYRTTWHHNWWGPGCKQRMLACRFGGAHMFNNFWSCAGNDYCTTSRNIAQMLSEQNSYKGVKDPLEKQNSGLLKTIGNLFSSCTGAQTISNDAVFTPPYSYRLDRASEVEALVTAGAGNVGAASPAPLSASISGNTTVVPGGVLTLTAPADYTTYQWRLGNVDIPGATAASYSVNNVTAADAGTYTVVSGFFGRSDSVVSAPITVSVSTPILPPSITTQPESQSVAVGAAVSLRVVATGDAPLSYRWQKSTLGTFIDVPGATSATLSIASAQLSDSGTFRVLVSNAGGSTTSESASLAVSNPTYAVTPPDGFAFAVTGGGSVAAVTANTADAFKSAVEAANPAVVTVSGTLTLPGGKVDVKSNKTIQGADGMATIVGCLDLGSGGVSNVLIRGLNITNPAGDGVTVRGATNVFITHCTVFDCSDGLIDINNGSDNVTVSWCEFYYTPAQTDHRFTMIVGSAGAETKPLHITLHHNWWSDRCDQRMPSGTFGYVHLYNNYFTASGNSYTTNARATSQFLVERSVYVAVKDPLYKEGGGLMRSIENVFTSTTGQAPDSGTDTIFTPPYSYLMQPTGGSSGLEVPALLVANAGNTAGLNSLSPQPLAASITGPSSGSTFTAAPGGNFALNAAFAGFVPATCQWRLNNFPVTGGAAATLTVSGMDASKAGAYTVALTTSTGETVVSTPFTVTLGTLLPPTITTQPADLAVTQGGSATFTVVASGDGILTYQWRKGSTPIAGATSSSYTIASSASGDAGQYSVVITNAAGSVTSNSATLTVNAPSTNGGGGAPSAWFFGALVAAAALRRLRPRG